jgi:hypothetical protein
MLELELLLQSQAHQFQGLEAVEEAEEVLHQALLE